jgi:hypothetical protein
VSVICHSYCLNNNLGSFDPQVKGGLAGLIECKQSHLPTGNSEADLCCFGRARGNSIPRIFGRPLSSEAVRRRRFHPFFDWGARLYRQKRPYLWLLGKFRQQFSILQFSRFFTKTCALL